MNLKCVLNKIFIKKLGDFDKVLEFTMIIRLLSKIQVTEVFIVKYFTIKWEIWIVFSLNILKLKIFDIKL